MCLVLAACGSDEAPEQVPAVGPPAYAGSGSCRRCHEGQFLDWHESQHFLAMQAATGETVVGNFNDTSFSYAGMEYEFYIREGRFYVLGDDSSGEPVEFEISHTFGVEPLQQYLITFPDGRRQALSIAWDTRPLEDGGQRWFHLYPEAAVTHEDALHWTGRNQNWNYMCADCHSTDLKKNYKSSNKSYDTSWAEISVGCEACHGPGSVHVAVASSSDYGSSSLTTSLATQEDEVDTCARCHSRRGVIAEGFTPGDPFLDYYRPALLDDGLYHADGQIQDEVYVYGSFLQSRMHQRGVRCTDCHNPHTAGLDATGNATCTRCHQETPPTEFATLAPKLYDAVEHHFHEPGTEGAECVNCHMPSKLYMVVDPRRDHSFRIPRPDLTESLGVPNACNTCHDDQTPAWAAAEIRQRFPDLSMAHYGEVIAAGRSRDSDASVNLAVLAADTTAPAIARGTALSLLAGLQDEAAMSALARGVTDTDPLVRFGALRGLQGMDIGRAWPFAEHLLSDRLRVIRIEAASLLSPALASDILQADRDRLMSAIDENIAALLVNDDRPESLTNLGGIQVNIGNNDAAERAYRNALDLDSRWVPALVNLADLYRGQGRNDESASLLDEAISVAPENGDVRYAYGLALVRQGRSSEALDELSLATAYSPGNAHYIYVYGVALNSVGQAAEAVAALAAGHEKFPDDIDILYALATIERDRGSTARALIFARRLQSLRPSNPEFQAFVQQLESVMLD